MSGLSLGDVRWDLFFCGCSHATFPFWELELKTIRSEPSTIFLFGALAWGSSLDKYDLGNLAGAGALVC